MNVFVKNIGQHIINVHCPPTRIYAFSAWVDTYNCILRTRDAKKNNFSLFEIASFSIFWFLKFFQSSLAKKFFRYLSDTRKKYRVQSRRFLSYQKILKSNLKNVLAKRHCREISAYSFKKFLELFNEFVDGDKYARLNSEHLLFWWKQTHSDRTRTFSHRLIFRDNPAGVTEDTRIVHRRPVIVISPSVVCQPWRNCGNGSGALPIPEPFFRRLCIKRTRRWRGHRVPQVGPRRLV